MKEQNKAIAGLFRDQHGALHRAQALHVGATRGQIDSKVANGEWERLHRNVYRLAASPRSFEQRLLGACLAAGPGAVASHESAAWLWGLLGNQPPTTPAVTVGRPAHPRISGVTVHRVSDLDPLRSIYRRNIPCTDPLRMVVDLAGVASTGQTTAVVDRALASGLLSGSSLAAELERRSSQGRPGSRALREILSDRGIIGGPEPSVLEAETLRLFARWQIEVREREVHVGPDGRYRIDFALRPPVAVEVDGYAYHWSPESKSYDEARRNQLRLQGIFLLVYTWRDIRIEAARVIDEVTAALRSYAA
jgi:hypothetical protein